MSKQNIIILCGGQSAEHEVSLMSAKSIVKFIPKDLYQPIPIGISKEGRWLAGENFFENEDDPKNICLGQNLREVELKDGYIDNKKVDLVFPILHGTFGEDGCMQGVLEIAKIAYVGSGVMGSAIGMDKDIMKRLVSPEGILCAKHIAFYKYQNKIPNYDEVKNKLGDTVFVKPCCQGSSIGISKCVNKSQYDEAVKLAFRYDYKVLVEEYVKGREIEVSVLGHHEVSASLPGEIIPTEDFYSYNAKYISSDDTELKVPAELDEKTKSDIQNQAIKVFRLLELSGMARVDFFLKETGEIYFNEVNTLPGFTSISMYAKLWEVSGIKYPELIHQLIKIGQSRFSDIKALERDVEI